MRSVQERVELLSRVLSERRFARMKEVVAERTRHLTVVLEDLHHEHNTSAVVRSAECFGIQDVYIVEQNNAYSMSTGVSRGATDWLTVHRYHQRGAPNMQRCCEDLRARGYTIVGTSPHATTILSELPIDKPLALVFGTELTGMSQEAYNHVDHTITIPMYGFTESFNVSVSAALCLYDLSTRLRASSHMWRLSESEQYDLLLTWVRAHITNPDQVEEALAAQMNQI